jgi:integrase
MALTARGLKALASGKWLAESARGEGQLRAKGGTSGTRFYFRYRRDDRRTDDLPLGLYDPEGKTGLSLKQAEAKAGELRKQYNAGTHDLRAALDTERRERERQHKATEAAERAASEAEAVKRTRTLGALLTAYADQLSRDGKPSARSVRGELFHHVRDAWPKLWAQPLADVTTDDLLAVVALPVEHGHKRQAEKVRAYLRAAFAAGMKARHNAAALPAMRALRITANPARDLTPIEGANRARDRALSLSELRAYWHRIRKAPEHAALRFHLLTGCQRIAQLARARLSDFDADTQTLRLLDGKGRRSEPRQHHVPIVSDALHAITAMQSGIAGPYLFTVTAGVSGMDYSGLCKRVHAITDAMLAAGELPGGTFTPGDLRRTVETRLADAGVSIETRARLQSHGLGGVQARHYNMHDYLAETRAALETLHRLLTSTGAKVVPIRRKA